MEDCCVVGGDEFTMGLGRLLQMWVAIWWQWVCVCSNSLSQIGCKFWFNFEFSLWVSVHLQVHGGGSGGLLWWWWGWVHCGFTEVATDLGKICVVL